MISSNIYLNFTTVHIVLWMLVYRLLHKKTDLLSPFYMVSGLYWLIFVFAPNVWIARGQTAYQGVEVMEYLPKATIIFNIGYFVYSVASVSARESSRKQKKYDSAEYAAFCERPDVNRLIVRYAWFLFGCSLLLTLLYYQLTGRSPLYMLTLGQGASGAASSGYGFYFLGQFIRSAIPGLMLLIAFSKKKRILIYAMIYVMISVCISTGSRNLVINVVLAIVAYFYVSRNKRPSVTIVLVAVAGLYLFVGFVGIFRMTIKSGGAINLSAMDTESMFRAFMYNVEIFFPFYTLVGYIPDKMTFHYGLGILNILIQFIPRAIWSGKPATIGKTAFEAMYGSSMGGAAYPNIAEFYYELGMLGTCVCMFLSGMLLQRLYNDMCVNKSQISNICFCIMFGYLMQFVCRGHFTSWAIDGVLMFVPLMLLNHILKRKYREVQSENSISHQYSGTI